MGIVFGKTNVAEPAFELLYTSSSSSSSGPSFLAYELRRYGVRFAAETDYDPHHDKQGDSSSFKRLAEYIGVFGTPHNRGNTSIAMTAPVAMKSFSPQKILMTAPVSTNSENHFMRFFLPEQYYIHPQQDIPTPTDPRVRIVEIPSAVGAVHRYTGSMDPQTAQTHALTLGRQLQSHYFANNTTTNLSPLTDEMILQQYEFWGYNPPFTIPFLRRNEVWIPLTEEQVQVILQQQQQSNHPTSSASPVETTTTTAAQ
jgi:hypothetical protein